MTLAEAVKSRDKFLKKYSHGLKLGRSGTSALETKPNTELIDAQRRIKVQNQVRIKRIKPAKGPEYKIQQDIIPYLEDRGWKVRVMAASMYIYGFPDLWAGHPKYGERWIEVKNPASYKFTAAQIHLHSAWFFLCFDS